MDTSKHGGRNPLADAALEIDIFGGDSERDAMERELDKIRGEKVADRIEDDPRLKASRPVAADPGTGVEASNPVGSFEIFQKMMGGPRGLARPGK